MTITLFGAAVWRQGLALRLACRLGLCTVAVALQFVSQPTLAADELDRKVSLDIPENTPLQDALIEWGAKTGVTVMINAASVEHQLIRAVHGTLTARSAIALILSNTGLSYTQEGDRIRVVPVTAALRSMLEEAPQAPASSGNSNRQIGGETGVDATADTARRKDLAEVVVTAEKRSERLQDVPISIVAISSEELSNRNVHTMDDLVTAVPGLAVTDAAGSRRIFLRGIGNIFGSSSALIGIYLDEASVTSSSAAQLDLRTYDLERVEVLRGPQGTLYGEGSVGGTIRFITRNPQLDRVEMAADVAALFTENGAPGQRIESVLNVPLVDNVWGLRIVGTFDHEGGWIDQPAANLKNFNSQNIADVRIKSLWQPLAQFSVNAMAVIHRNDGTQNPGEDASGNYTQSFNLTTTPSTEDDYDIFNLTLDYDFSGARLLSTSSYIKQDQLNRNIGGSAQYTPPGTPRYDFYSLTSDTTSRNYNEELRLTSSEPGPWNWTIGGFYRHFRNGVDTPTAYADFAAPPGTPLPAPYSYQFNNLSESESAFGDTSYKLFDRLTLGAGLRYFLDRQEYSSGAVTLGPNQTGRFHSLDPRVSADYKVTDRLNVYTSAAKGFRSGGFNLLNQPKFGPENVWTYELGAKSSLLDNQLTLNGDVFYSTYKDYQINGIAPPPALPLDIYRNAGDARIKGVEWDVSWRPAQYWTLSLSGDYLDTRFTRIDVTAAAYVVGDPVDFIPKYQYTASVQRDFHWKGKPVYARLDYSQQGRETYRNRTIPDYFGESDVIYMLNLNTNVQWSDTLSLGFFAQNLLNDRANVDPAYIDGGGPERVRPRTYGVQFSVKLD
jgi:iron complex outermembrane recepter protein